MERIIEVFSAFESVLYNISVAVELFMEFSFLKLAWIWDNWSLVLNFVGTQWQKDWEVDSFVCLDYSHDIMQNLKPY